DRPRRLRLPGALAVRMAGRPGLPSALLRRDPAGNPDLLLVPVDGPPGRVAERPLALPRRPAAGVPGAPPRTPVAGNHSVSPRARAALGHDPGQPRGRGRRAPRNRFAPGTHQPASDRGAGLGDQRRGPGGDGPPPRVGGRPALLDLRRLLALGPPSPMEPGPRRDGGAARPGSDLSSALPPGGPGHALLGDRPPTGARNGLRGTRR